MSHGPEWSYASSRPRMCFCMCHAMCIKSGVQKKNTAKKSCPSAFCLKRKNTACESSLCFEGQKKYANYRKLPWFCNVVSAVLTGKNVISVSPANNRIPEPQQFAVKAHAVFPHAFYFFILTFKMQYVKGFIVLCIS